MGNKLFVGNLDYKVSEDVLRELFERCGKVVDVSIPVDRETNRPRGFAFVTMEDQEAADRALGLNGEMFEGRELVVKVANSTFGSGGGSGGGRNDRRGSGGGSGGGNPRRRNF